MSAAMLRFVATAVADLLAAASGAGLFLATGEFIWLVTGILLSALITFVFLLPAFRALQEETKGRARG